MLYDKTVFSVYSRPKAAQFRRICNFIEGEPMAELKRLNNGQYILPLMATTIEYGEHLKNLIQPHIIGVGPVEAAMNTMHILCESAERPNFVILIGSSGSAMLAQGEVYQASSVSYRDMDASAIGFTKGKTPFVDLPAELPLDPLFDFLTHATLSTGGKVIVGDEFSEQTADMVDMESFAVKRVCQAFDIPMIVVRGISDGKEELQKFDDWTELLPELDQKFAKATAQIFDELGAD
jgi:adenosylhomocysteine nucleosidase